MAGAREPSMEDILASIKRVIAEEKEIRAAAPPQAEDQAEDGDILELDQSMEAPAGPPADLGPPLLEEEAADQSRQKLEALASVAATAPPPPQGNPLEEMVRDMLKPILKEWLDQHLPAIVDEHVRREL